MNPRFSRMDKMPKFEDLEFYRQDGHNQLNQQDLYYFPNGFGASVILGKYTYGLEMMAITPDRGMNDFEKEQLEKLDQDLYFDVVGYMTKERLYEWLDLIDSWVVWSNHRPIAVAYIQMAFNSWKESADED